MSERSAWIICKAGDVNMVRVLGERGADLNTAMSDGATPAYVASENGHARWCVL